MSWGSVTGTKSDNGVYWLRSAYTWMLLFAKSFMVHLKFHCLALNFLVEALDRTCTDREALPGDLLGLVNLSLLTKAFVVCFQSGFAWSHAS